MMRDEIERRRDPTKVASGSVAVSFVYPTRNRPEFVHEALAILAMQQGGSFEVVVSDNYGDRKLACEQVCVDSGLRNLRYIHPPKPLSMAENWEYPLSFATGEYVAYLTDKMFVLPSATWHIEGAATSRPEIISWVPDSYQPAYYPDYFGDGAYHNGVQGRGGSFSPSVELDRRGMTGRSADSQPDYCRGKIVFGAFHRDLIARIVSRFGALFWNPEWGSTGLSPDYTSMILGLSDARTAVELTASFILQIHTDISGGMLIDTKDAVARAALDEALWPDLPIPNLYASQHNIVARDYVALKEKYDLPFAFDLDTWVKFCEADINRPGRVWSSGAAESHQKDVLARFLATRNTVKG